jgi:hypothetical protein
MTTMTESQFANALGDLVARLARLGSARRRNLAAGVSAAGADPALRGNTPSASARRGTRYVGLAIELLRTELDQTVLIAQRRGVSIA